MPQKPCTSRVPWRAGKLGAAGITGDDLNFRPHEFVQGARNITSWAAALAPPTISSVVKISSTVFARRGVPGDADAVLDIGVADQLNFSGSKRASGCRAAAPARRSGCDGEFGAVARALLYT